MLTCLRLSFAAAGPQSTANNPRAGSHARSNLVVHASVADMKSSLAALRFVSALHLRLDETRAERASSPGRKMRASDPGLHAGRSLAHEAVVESLGKIDLGALELRIELRKQLIGVLHALFGDDAGLRIHFERSPDRAFIHRLVAEIIFLRHGLYDVVHV